VLVTGQDTVTDRLAVTGAHVALLAGPGGRVATAVTMTASWLRRR
jgi:hypothetical protein